MESEVGEEGTTWSEQHSHLHERFDLAENNDGHALFRQLVDAGVENWVGEPSAMLIARSALDGGRLFSSRVHQTLDLDLWLRIMLRHASSAGNSTSNSRRTFGTGHAPSPGTRPRTPTESAGSILSPCSTRRRPRA